MQSKIKVSVDRAMPLLSSLSWKLNMPFTLKLLAISVNNKSSIAQVMIGVVMAVILLEHSIISQRMYGRVIPQSVIHTKQRLLYVHSRM